MKKKHVVLRALSLGLSVSLAAVVVAHAGCGASPSTTKASVPPSASYGPMPPPGYMPATKAPSPMFYPPQQAGGR